MCGAHLSEDIDILAHIIVLGQVEELADFGGALWTPQARLLLIRQAGQYCLTWRGMAGRQVKSENCEKGRGGSNTRHESDPMLKEVSKKGAQGCPLTRIALSLTMAFLCQDWKLHSQTMRIGTRCQFNFAPVLNFR